MKYHFSVTTCSFCHMLICLVIRCDPLQAGVTQSNNGVDYVKETTFSGW